MSEGLSYKEPVKLLEFVCNVCDGKYCLSYVSGIRRPAGCVMRDSGLGAVWKKRATGQIFYVGPLTLQKEYEDNEANTKIEDFILEDLDVKPARKK